MDKTLPFAEAAVEAEEGSGRSNSNNCLNCSTPLVGVYCSHCGQKDIPPRQAFGELMINFASSFWSFESKFFSSIKTMALRPGKMAKEYTEGKRERYFHPARMYVFISFVYFLLLGILPDGEQDPYKKEYGDPEKYSKGWKYDNVVGGYSSLEQYDSAQSALPAAQRDGTLKRKLYTRIFAVHRKYSQSGTHFGTDFKTHFTANVPKMFFILLPIFALLLKLFYIRRDFYYSEHLVFSIYYYNFFFLAGCVYMLLNLVPVINSFVWVIGVWVAAYLAFALKRMYGQSWGKTILKFCTFVLVFSFCILFSLATNAVITLLII